jgi:hypothetical protein
MIGFGGFDPAVVPIIDDVGKLAGIKDQEKFRQLMMEVVNTAHRIAGNNPELLKGASKARQLIDELEGVLNANPNLSRRLGWRMEAFDNLSEGLHKLGQLERHGQPNKWAPTIRKRFVNGLIDATEAAGGRLGLDRPNGRGTLDEAIKLLRPCLPQDAFRQGLSISTLKTIKAERAKKPQKMV